MHSLGVALLFDLADGGSKGCLYYRFRNRVVYCYTPYMVAGHRRTASFGSTRTKVNCCLVSQPSVHLYPFTRMASSAFDDQLLWQRL